MSFFELIRKVGSGTFSYVFLAEAKYDRKLFAIKVVNRVEYLKVGQLNNLINQFEIMKILRNKPFIAKLYYAFEDVLSLFSVVKQCLSSHGILPSRRFILTYITTKTFLKPSTNLFDTDGFCDQFCSFTRIRLL